MDILEYGKEQLIERDLNLLVLKEDKEIVFQSNKMGILPMYEFYRLNFEEEVYVIDKFIGLGASRLLLNSKSKLMGLFTFVISKDAKELLKDNNIEVVKEREVEKILNKDKTDFCPIEKLSMENEKFDVFLEKLEEFIGKMKQK
ncbi:DUF1893 domain-containing protein [Lagierella massiliensis]|uniref:DUF1893 domain-containing protein n=1 Tax=Lagierella massiliensis TaxID=1689303 RepID=UPI0006D7D8EC|nr:DUF1893 domain-containing protein [Lagierella massiliensis]